MNTQFTKLTDNTEIINNQTNILNIRLKSGQCLAAIYQQIKAGQSQK